ncbi:hypothetical protein TanjilG_20477 [Lupinus angustifolius]|uniref:Uncharacterized protein n=1 Tax=Lupinus angustifolius TaxID=3871 RepID=A0A1J7HEU0_LUPAN|nr:PREDICTED: uncharacterized protein LOC109348339 [Lupinus angustifolius]OIW11328.1 hypothetical protein TanjilG_20477 [Lupinus angustifolius]
MRGIVSCYNEHAIRVSDSYCSRNSSTSNQPYICPKQNPSTPHSITCIYKLNLISHQTQFLITLTWTKKLIHQGFTINIHPYDSDSRSSLLLQKNKGTETFQVYNFEVQLIWDISDAIYYEGPEPVKGFYIIVLINSELGLLLGDKEEEWLKNMKIVNNSSMVSRSELFFNSTNVYATKAKFCETGISHDIVIKCGVVDEGSKSYNHYHNHSYSYNHNNYGLCVYMDKKTIFEVKRLRWNFRGNQTIFVDGLVVDFMWDVHDWIFNQNKGSIVFMFRTRSGLDHRLWLEEKNLKTNKEFQDRGIGLSLLICACKNPD